MRASLGLRVLLFTLLVPGTVLGVGPWFVLRPRGGFAAFAAVR